MPERTILERGNDILASNNAAYRREIERLRCINQVLLEACESALKHVERYPNPALNENGVSLVRALTEKLRQAIVKTRGE